MDAENTLEALLEGYPVVISVTVQWGDQDAFGHVNNTVYFRWFESARIAYFLRIGLRTLQADERVGSILASSSCEYRKSITFPDTVRVGVRVTRIGRTSIGFEHRIVSEAQGRWRPREPRRSWSSITPTIGPVPCRSPSARRSGRWRGTALAPDSSRIEFEPRVPGRNPCRIMTPVASG